MYGANNPLSFFIGWINIAANRQVWDAQLAAYLTCVAEGIQRITQPMVVERMRVLEFYLNLMGFSQSGSMVVAVEDVGARSASLLDDVSGGDQGTAQRDGRPARRRAPLDGARWGYAGRAAVGWPWRLPIPHALVDGQGGGLELVGAALLRDSVVGSNLAMRELCGDIRRWKHHR